MSQSKRRILHGSIANVTRLMLTVPFALILPPLFVHRMASAEYGAWMLILQGSAYINLLDIGLQTASCCATNLLTAVCRPISNRLM